MLALGQRSDMRVWNWPVGHMKDPDNRGAFITVGQPGQGDIGGIWRRCIHGVKVGIHIEIEVKTGKGRLSAQQKKRRVMVDEFGGIYLECRSVEDALRFFGPDPALGDSHPLLVLNKERNP